MLNEMTSASARGSLADAAIRPFVIHVPEADVVDLRRRLAATRWPDRSLRQDTREAQCPPKWV
jgi:hypothetical protein